nr:murein L,D-transpeptidase catalytic domain family protein [Flavihumibacter rivuli]
MTGSGKRAPLSSTVMEALKPAHKEAIKLKDELLVEVSRSLYQELNLKKFGLSEQAFQYAFKGYTRLREKGLLNREDVLSICDFSQSSRRKRMYIIDVEEKKVLLNTYVAHGRNSGGEYAKKFSNRPESHQSSLGFYITRNTYYGEHGLALKIDGVDKGFNDLANARNIVVHGSDYVGAGFIRYNKFNGRSFGCPAVPKAQSEKVINTIKRGTCLFIYHPSRKYLTQSRILNS